MKSRRVGVKCYTVFIRIMNQSFLIDLILLYEIASIEEFHLHYGTFLFDQ